MHWQWFKTVKYNPLTPDDFIYVIRDTKYPACKPIANEKYKTATIYGEMFIVIPTQLHEKWLLYINHLCSFINDLSSKMFLPAGSEKECSQANIWSFLTASFKAANMFENIEIEEGVSSTRIRISLAT